MGSIREMTLEVEHNKKCLTREAGWLAGFMKCYYPVVYSTHFKVFITCLIDCHFSPPDGATGGGQRGDRNRDEIQAFPKIRNRGEGRPESALCTIN